MDWQTAFNVVFGVASALIGWVMRVVWDAQQRVQRDLADLERNLPSVYVRRDDYRSDIRELKEMLSRIADKLDEKADK